MNLKVNAMLMAHSNRVMETMHGFGKRIINPREHNLLGRKIVKKSIKVYQNAGRVIAATPLDKLDDDQKAEIIDSANRWRTAELFTNELLKKPRVKGKDKAERDSLAFDVLKYLSGNVSP